MQSLKRSCHHIDVELLWVLSVEVKLNSWSIEVEVLKLAVCPCSPKCWLRRLSDLTVRALNSSVCPGCAYPTSELMSWVAGCQSLIISSDLKCADVLRRLMSIWIMKYLVVWIGLLNSDLFPVSCPTCVLKTLWRYCRLLSEVYLTLSYPISFLVLLLLLLYVSPSETYRCRSFSISCLYIKIQYCCI
jgi:hypothetical protein